MRQVELRDAGKTIFLAPLRLEQEIRQGKVLGSAEVRYEPWTGTEFARIETLAPLAHALDAPAARAAARLARRPFPQATALLCLLLLLTVCLQYLFSQIGLTPEQRGAVGFEPTLLDGAWWRPWTAPLLHVNILHLASRDWKPIGPRDGMGCPSAPDSRSAPCILAWRLAGGPSARTGSRGRG